MLLHVNQRLKWHRCIDATVCVPVLVDLVRSEAITAQGKEAKRANARGHKAPALRRGKYGGSTLFALTRSAGRDQSVEKNQEFGGHTRHDVSRMGQRHEE